MVKTKQVTVKQLAGENNTYTYKVVRLQNRTTPTVDTVLTGDELGALIAEEGTTVTVQ